MMEPRQHDLGFVEGDLRRRGVYLLPGAFTVGNLLCGFYAVLATLQGGASQLDDAARAIGFAIVFDAFDGFVARMTHTNTEFGKQFDSLADMVSFGIAPAVLAFAWGVQVMMQGGSAEGRHVHQLAWLVCLAFVICCAWRLARFNVHGMAPGRLALLCGYADACRGGNDCGDGSLRRRPHRRLAMVAGLAGAGPLGGGADGQFSPLSEFQGPALGQAPAFFHHHCRDSADRRDHQVFRRSVDFNRRSLLPHRLGIARGAARSAPIGIAHCLKCLFPKIPCAWPSLARRHSAVRT